jgi:hypothetical protein
LPTDVTPMRDLASPQSRDTTAAKVKTIKDIRVITSKTVFTRKTEVTTKEVESSPTLATATSTITSTLVGTGTDYITSTIVTTTTSFVILRDDSGYSPE